MNDREPSLHAQRPAPVSTKQIAGHGKPLLQRRSQTAAATAAATAIAPPPAVVVLAPPAVVTVVAKPAALPFSVAQPLSKINSTISDAELAAQMANVTKGFSSQRVDHGYWVENSMIEGTIPAELEGTLLRNGPGIFEIGERKVPQPFDGDGLVCSFAFKDGKAFFRNKLVRTEGLVAEQKVNKQLYASAFNKGIGEGMWFNNPLNISVKNVANTNVIHWGGKTLALYERGLPYALDNNLTTVGTDDLAGTVDGKKFFGAHYRMVAQPDGSQRLVAFSFTEQGNNGLITVWEYDTDFKCLHKEKFIIKDAAFGFFHDLVVTEQYYVFVENPLTLNLFKIATQYTIGLACIAECLEFDLKKKVKVHVMARPGTAADALLSPSHTMRSYTVPGAPFFSFHHSNGFETKNGNLVVDTNAFGWINLGQTEPDITSFRDPNRRDDLNRLVINLETGQVSRNQVHARNSDLPSISPHKHGLPNQYTYLVASALEGSEVWGPTNSVWKVGMDPELGNTIPFNRSMVTSTVWTPSEGKFAQEPVFVPRNKSVGANAAEDDGWVMSMVFDSTNKTSSLVILDAQRMDAGPVCTIKLPHHIPLGLHGSFTSSYLGPSPGATDCCFENDTQKNGV